MLLCFSSTSIEPDLRQAIIECGQICYKRGLLTSTDGNISVRLGDERILITPSGMCKGRMDITDLLMMDLDGNMISMKEGRKPSSETPMHLEVYQQRPDARAVLHAHPIFATVLTVSDFPVSCGCAPGNSTYSYGSMAH